MEINMKKFTKSLITVSAIVLASLQGYAQSNRLPLEDVVNAIRNSRIEDMSRYFDNVVPVTLNNSQAIYSRNQAEAILKDFLEKNPPRDFTVMDNGSPNSSSKFMIGSMLSTTGVRYNVYILMKLKDNNYVLQEIRFNKE
jgi:hypothetical protein